MSSTPKQNPSLHAMTQGFSQVLSEQASQWPMTPGGPVAAALSLGSEDHGTLRQEWLEGQAELWQAMLEQAVARAGQKVAASPRDDQSFDDPMRGQNDMSDYRLSTIGRICCDRNRSSGMPRKTWEKGWSSYAKPGSLTLR